MDSTEELETAVKSIAEDDSEAEAENSEADAGDSDADAENSEVTDNPAAAAAGGIEDSEAEEKLEPDAEDKDAEAED